VAPEFTGAALRQPQAGKRGPERRLSVAVLDQQRIAEDEIGLRDRKYAEIEEGDEREGARVHLRGPRERREGGGIANEFEHVPVIGTEVLDFQRRP